MAQTIPHSKVTTSNVQQRLKPVPETKDRTVLVYAFDF